MSWQSMSELKGERASREVSREVSREDVGGMQGKKVSWQVARELGKYYPR